MDSATTVNTEYLQCITRPCVNASECFNKWVNRDVQHLPSLICVMVKKKRKSSSPTCLHAKVHVVPEVWQWRGGADCQRPRTVPEAQRTSAQTNKHHLGREMQNPLFCMKGHNLSRLTITKTAISLCYIWSPNIPTDTAVMVVVLTTLLSLTFS